MPSSRSDSWIGEIGRHRSSHTLQRPGPHFHPHLLEWVWVLASSNPSYEWISEYVSFLVWHHLKKPYLNPALPAPTGC